MMKIPFNDLRRINKDFEKMFISSFKSHLKNHDFINGNSVNKFEKTFSNNLKSNFLACSNGTDAITAALNCLNIGHGDEVILPAMSWFSTAEVISLVGAKPVFIDVDEYYCIDETKIEQKITKNTKAIIVVHLYGQMCNMHEILKISKKYNLKLIEDCAQSHFSKYNNKFAGNFGDIGTFSFYPGKNLGSVGDAGGICSTDKKLYYKLKRFINHGSLKKHEHSIIGTNSRLDSMHASFLDLKLPYLHQWNKERHEIANYYNQNLKNKNIISLPKIRENTYHTFHVYCVRVQRRDDFILHMKKNEIQTSIHYPVALPFLKPYDLENILFPKAYEYQSQIVSIPIYPKMYKSEMKYVVDVINSF